MNVCLCVCICIHEKNPLIWFSSTTLTPLTWCGGRALNSAATHTSGLQATRLNTASKNSLPV